jgi:hypothetical protein
MIFPKSRGTRATSEDIDVCTGTRPGGTGHRPGVHARLRARWSTAGTQDLLGTARANEDYSRLHPIKILLLNLLTSPQKGQKDGQIGV